MTEAATEVLSKAMRQPTRQRLRLVSRREAGFLLGALVMLIVAGAIVNAPLAITRFRGPQDRLPRGMSLRQPEIGNRSWPAPTPHAAAWPAPTHWDETRLFGARHYNVFHHTEEMRFQMQVAHYGFPLPVVEDKQMWWSESAAAPSGPEAFPRMRLLWPGLIVNPVLLGGSAFLILFGPLAAAVVGRRLVSRLARRAAGRCVFCAYPIGESPVCTECGRDLGGAAGRRR